MKGNDYRKKLAARDSGILHVEHLLYGLGRFALRERFHHERRYYLRRFIAS